MNWKLADVDGDLCVTSDVPDWSTPTIYTLHWPTTVRTHQFLRYHELADVAQANAEFVVTQSIPGEYQVRSKWQSYYLTLVNHGRTESVLTTARPAPRPKTRLQVEWRDGKWWKNTKAR